MQCLRNKIGQLEHFLELLKTNYHFLCVSEHWLRNEEVSRGLSIGRWDLMSVFSRKNHCHGGVAIFSKPELNCIVLEHANTLCNKI